MEIKLNKDILHHVVADFVRTESSCRVAESSSMVIGEFEKGLNRYQLSVTLTRCEDDMEEELDCQNVFIRV